MTDLTTLCDQRSTYLRNKPPPTRVELFNPYTAAETQQFTEYDYNMRRKAEILQYRSSRMPSQTNNLTKKQQFALIARGNFNAIPVPSQVLETDISFGLVATCPADESIPTLSTGADVPGPAITLYLNKNVPLYNYGAPVRSYPFPVGITQNTKFRTDTNTDLLSPHNQETDLCILTVNQNIDQPTYNFAFTFPLGIQVMGVIENNNINKPLPITATIYQLILNIYYSNNLVQTVSIPSSTLSSLTFSIANRTGAFNAVLYIGSITSQQIRLITQAGFIYQIKAIARLTTTGGGNNYFSNLSLYAIINKTSAVTKSETNCVITNAASIIPNNGFNVAAS